MVSNMGKRTFTVTLELEASSEDQILNTYGLGRIIDSRFCESFEIKDPDKRHYEIRCRRDKNFNGMGKYFVMEGKWSDEDEWGVIEAYEVDDCDKINYHILGWIKDQKNVWGRDCKFI